MPLTISSFYRSQMESTRPNSIYTKFTFNGSDMSGRVVKYGSISRSVEDVIGGDFSIEVENASQTFNSLTTDKTQFFKAGTFEYGFCAGINSYETLQLFGGKLVDANLEETNLTLTFEDVLSRLSSKKIGSSNSGSAVSYASSNHNPADLAWWLVTSYGGLSTVQSISNPDIDYTSWSTWRTVFSDDSVVVQAYFEGDDVITALKNIRQLTDSAIYAGGDNKLRFSRWTGAQSNDPVSLTNNVVLDEVVSLEIDAKDLINKVSVSIGYNPTSGSWAGELTTQNTASVNSYGEFKLNYDDDTVWYVNSVSASKHAERIVFRRYEPNIKLSVPTPFRFLDVELGDEVTYTSQVYSFNAKTFTLQEYEIDTEAKTMMLNLDEGFGRGPGRLKGFILDDAVYGLLDQTYNALY